MFPFVFAEINLEATFTALAWGGGILMLILFIVLGVGVLGALIARVWGRLWAELQKVDNNPAVLALGQSPFGQLAYQQLMGPIRAAVDQPNDPAIGAFYNLLNTTIAKILPDKPEMLSKAELSEGVTLAVDTLGKLLDGVAGNLVTPPVPPIYPQTPKG